MAAGLDEAFSRGQLGIAGVMTAVQDVPTDRFFDHLRFTATIQHLVASVLSESIRNRYVCGSCSELLPQTAA